MFFFFFFFLASNAQASLFLSFVVSVRSFCFQSLSPPTSTSTGTSSFPLIYLLVYFFLFSVSVYVSPLCNVNKVVFLSSCSSSSSSVCLK